MSRYAIFAFVFFVGCVPDLEDGHFACDDGVCPDGYSCRGDDLCYGPGAAASPMYALCNDDAECETGI